MGSELEVVKSLCGIPFSKSHLLLIPPQDEVDVVLKQFAEVQAKQPQTSACVLVPRRPIAPWSYLLQGWKKLKGYPMGAKNPLVSKSERSSAVAMAYGCVLPSSKASGFSELSRQFWAAAHDLFRFCEWSSWTLCYGHRR
jgi:hypothetical protein